MVTYIEILNKYPGKQEPCALLAGPDDFVMNTACIP